MSTKAFDDWTAADKAGLLTRLQADGSLVRHRRLDDPPANLEPGLWAAVLEVERLPVITYPYEWSFEMLRQAALLTLDVSTTCLDAGFQLKDASAYNIAFARGRPLFLDIGSIEKGYGGLWIGYSQFVSHFLIPLLVTAHLKIPFQPLLRAHLEGVPLEVGARMFHGRQGLRPGIAFHVRYAARVTQRASRRSADDRKRLTRELKVPIEGVKGNIGRLRRLIEGLKGPTGTEWIDYERSNTYADDETRAKLGFVAAAARDNAGAVAWDVGANAGLFSTAMVDHFDSVVAIEPDPGAADLLHRRSLDHANLHPVVMDITDPSRDRGWRLQERASLSIRAPADFSTWLAVIHHLCLGRGYPLSEVMALIAETSPVAVVEFVDAEDDMAVELLASRNEVPHGYSRSVFQTALTDRFDVIEHLDLTPTRTLFLIRRR